MNLDTASKRRQWWCARKQTLWFDWIHTKLIYTARNVSYLLNCTVLCFHCGCGISRVLYIISSVTDKYHRIAQVHLPPFPHSLCILPITPSTASTIVFVVFITLIYILYRSSKGISHRFSDSSTPPSCSPSPSEISDSAIADNGRTSTACQTSFVFPLLMENEMRFPYINLSGWRREEVCCGTIFKGPNGEVLVDPKLLKPHCYCARGQSKNLVKQNSLEN